MAKNIISPTKQAKQKINNMDVRLINEDLLEVIFRTSKSIEVGVEKLLKNYDICLREFAILEALHTLGASPVQQIAKRVLVTSGSMTYFVKSLVSKGYIDRNASLQDGRRFMLSLTKKGESLIKELLKIHNAYIDNAFKVLSSKEKADIVTALSRLQENL